MNHLEIIAVMALVPLGAWVAMGEGMVLEWWSKFWAWLPDAIMPKGFDPSWTAFWMVAYLPLREFTNLLRWLSKPFATCPRCMCSIWGIPAALLAFPDLNLWLLPVYLLAAVGLQEAIHR
jgi:hypothetical protein